MKATKNAVLRSSLYTGALTRSLKKKAAAERLHCQVDEEKRAVYVCNGFFLAKLTPAEYDAFIRPVSQRDAGNFVLDQNGETISSKPLDMADMLNKSADEAAHEITPAPFLVPSTKDGKTQIACYYSAAADFVAGFNAEYAAILSDGLTRKSKSPVSPMVIYSGDEPLAMVMPIKLEDKTGIVRATRAYFNAPPAAEDGSEDDGSTAARLERIRKDRDQWRTTAEALERDRNGLEFQNGSLHRDVESLQAQYVTASQELLKAQEHAAELENTISAKNEQIEALVSRLNALPDPLTQEAAQEAEPQPAALEPADKAAALVEKLEALEWISATVKGAQTAAPVIWISGDADAHKAAIEAMGGRYSTKRAAWYLKV